MLRTTLAVLQKRQTQSGFMAAAGKVGNEEKWSHAVMEYIYEKNHATDPKKRLRDVEAEVSMSLAYDRYNAVAQGHFEDRMKRLLTRLTEALESIPCDAMREEALLLNSQQMPLNFRRPSLTPPVHGYEPGYGLDVPQLRAQLSEYPLTVRPTDRMEFGSEAHHEGAFPFVETDDIALLTASASTKLMDEHGALREAAPVTGVEGEAWEAYVALCKKALARQKLIVDLSMDVELRERYDSDEAFRTEELQRRGMQELSVENVDTCRLGVMDPAHRHYAQEPHYQPIRNL